MIGKVRIYFEQVISEARKISWANRNEVYTSTIFVLIMVSIASLFLLFVDFGAYNTINFLLNLGT